MKALKGQFGQRRIDNGFGIDHSFWAPLWLFAFVFGGMGIVLLSGRFSVRLLFVVTTLFAIMLGVMAYKSK